MGDVRLPRDAQRSRIYRAESPMASSPLPGLSACASFAEKVVGTLWWQARFPAHTLDLTPRLRPGNGARQAFFREELDGEPTITLPRRYRTKGVVLHELVHWALWSATDLPQHGSTFARVLLDATDEFLGVDRAGALAAAFARERVRVGEAPRPGPDGLLHYGWDERLRLGKGKRLTVHWRDGVATGLHLGYERAGSIVCIGDDGSASGSVHRIPKRCIWAIQGVRAARAA